MVFEMPVFAFGFIDWSVLLIAWGLFFIVYFLKAYIQKGKRVFADSNWGRLFEKFFPYRFQNGQCVNITDVQVPQRNKYLIIAGIFMALIGVINWLVLPIIISHPVFRNQAYRDLLGTVQESSFTADIEPINLNQIRIVDEETAMKVAEKKIGEIPALGSEVRMGDMSIQKVRDKLYYVAPLEHRGIFQWLTNRSQGSKGFIMVSATNPQDVKLVQTINGEPVYLKYQMRGFILDYLPRYLYVHGIVNVGMADFSFEVDDDLNPYWVTTLYKNKVGYSGADAVGVVLVNARSGEFQRYNMDSVPDWVDRVHPESFVYRQVTDWGQYINGFWNTIFAKTGTLRPTSDRLNLIYGNDNRVYWYTGITSSGKDESTVGFILIDSRTKEAKWYKVAGATEAAAKKSAEGQVQEKGYRAGETVLYNVHGIPTYISPLKDKEGLLKLVSLVSVENYNLVGVGPDIDSALRAYQLSLANMGNTFIPGNELKQVKLQGKIVRFTQIVKGGDSYFYFTLEGDKRIFSGSVNTSAKMPLVVPGDIVTIQFNDSSAMPIGVTQFELVGF